MKNMKRLLILFLLGIASVSVVSCDNWFSKTTTTASTTSLVSSTVASTVTDTSVTATETTTTFTTTTVSSTDSSTITTTTSTTTTTVSSTTTATSTTTTSSEPSLLNIDYSGFSNYYASIQDSTDVISDMASLLRSTIRYVTYGEARYIYYEYDDGSQVVLYDWPSSSTYQQIPLTWGSGGSITSPVSVTINREHVWARNDMKIKPQSGSTSISRYEPHILDNGTFYHSPSNTDSGLYSDLFNLWNSLASPNSTHGDSFFGEESGASAKYYSSGGVFYPGDEYKGDIARMLFYMTLMYPYLTLVDKGDSNAVEGSYFYGYLDVLLEWNAEDPVSDYEIAKAQLNFDEQRNRNPFVDFYDQDFAELLFAYGDPNVAD